MKQAGRALIYSALAALGLIFASSSATTAAQPTSGKVVACSAYGNGCYEARIRKGRYGQEMRLKSGTWIDCRGDCRETLREETVDFWETQNRRAKSSP